MNSNYDIVLHKVDLFIKRRLFQKFFSILIFSILFIAITFLIFVTLEFKFYLPGSVRKIVTFGVISFLIIGMGFIIFRLFFLIKKIKSGEERKNASLFIGKNFKERVNDRILNIIELREVGTETSKEKTLINAGIEQKAGLVLDIPFNNLISYRNALLALYIFLVVSIFYGLGILIKPGFFKEPVQRIVKYDREFTPKAPFEIMILNELPLRSFRNNNLMLKIRTVGDFIPNSMYVVFDGVNSELKRNSSRNHFEYEFHNIVSDLKFYLKSGRYKFGPFVISAIDKALIKSFTVEVAYPEYTNIPKDVFVNQGDFSVPEGSVLSYVFYTEYADSVLFIKNNSNRHSFLVDNQRFIYDFKVMDSFDYSIGVVNEHNKELSNFKYKIEVIKDLYPEISVEYGIDSILNTSVYFRGNISDDYGFTGLTFNYRFSDDSYEYEQGDVFKIEEIPFNYLLNNQVFFFHIDVLGLGLKPGMKMEYFFEVQDNDGVNGYKSSRTTIQLYELGDKFELQNELLVSDENTKSGLSNSLNQLSAIQDEIDKLRRSIIDTDHVTWEQKELLKELLEKQNTIESRFEELKNQNSVNNLKKSHLTESDERILNKQAELEKLFDEVLTDELKDLYRLINEEVQDLSRNNMMNLMERMQFELYDFENRLDRALQLFKQLQVERLLSDAINQLTDFEKELTDLIESTVEENFNDPLVKRHSKLNTDFKKIEEGLNNLRNLNNELERPHSIENTEDLERDIDNYLINSLRNLNRNKAPQSINHQREALSRVSETKEKLQQSLEEIGRESLAEDIRTLREILDNILKVSFFQEELMDFFNDVTIRDPRYINLVQQQRRLKNDIELIKDSLIALSKRQIQIQSIVSREISEIDMNIAQAIDNLIERRKNNAMVRQQFVITHINNLALLLNESMQNMRTNMQAMSGEGNPEPGEGMDDLSSLRKMQEKMNKMLEQLRQRMSPESGQVGEGNSGLSEHLARLASEQEAIRWRLQEIMKEAASVNSNEVDQLLRDMERTELDIVNKNITRQTMLRQERILSRLLEHEKALLEQDIDERRVGETANFFEFSNPEEYFKYKQERIKTSELLRNLPPDFNRYYKTIIEQYLLNVQE